MDVSMRPGMAGPLVGYDIKSSQIQIQIQILAAFIGHRELEDIAPKFKMLAAERAQELFTLAA